MAGRSSRNALDDVDRGCGRRPDLGERARRRRTSRGPRPTRFDRLRGNGVITGFRASGSGPGPGAGRGVGAGQRGAGALGAARIRRCPGRYLAFSGSFDMVLLVQVPDIHRDVIMVRPRHPHVRTTHDLRARRAAAAAAVPDVPGCQSRFGVISGKRLVVRRVCHWGRSVRTLLDMTAVRNPTPLPRRAPGSWASITSNGGWATPAAAQFFSSGFGFTVRPTPASGPALVTASPNARQVTSGSS